MPLSLIDELPELANILVVQIGNILDDVYLFVDYIQHISHINLQIIQNRVGNPTFYSGFLVVWGGTLILPVEEEFFKFFI